MTVTTTTNAANEEGSTADYTTNIDGGVSKKKNTPLKSTSQDGAPSLNVNEISPDNKGEETGGTKDDSMMQQSDKRGRSEDEEGEL